MKNILLLDDNLDIIRIVEEVLAYEHYNVRSTTSCIDFIKVVENFRPDLILLDYRLSDGNGGELTRIIKAHPDLKEIPVVIFTAYMEPGLELFDFGCDAVISKPFDLQYLTDTIAQLITAKEQPRETIRPAADPLMSESMQQGLAQEKQRLHYQKHQAAQIRRS